MKDQIIFIDGEWNSYKGELISFALVPLDDSIDSLYFEIDLSTLNEPLDPWVVENVVPHLSGRGVEARKASWILAEYLRRFESVTFIADWPEDVERLCNLFVIGPGQALPLPLAIRFEIHQLCECKSEVPHHALHDAKANRLSYMRRLPEANR